MTSATAISVPGTLTVETVSACLGRHIALYKTYKPVYQTTLLQSLRDVWTTPDARVLDVGGGTGIIGQAIKDLFGAKSVTSVDVEDRFMPTLDIETRTFDGTTLPFTDGAFDCAVISNVLHHVPVAVRPGLMREVARATGHGPIYIKDHLSTSLLDRARLTALDAWGNIAFGGMVSATYLSQSEWEALAASCGYRIDATRSGSYRSGVAALAFPNRLETSMRWLAH